MDRISSGFLLFVFAAVAVDKFVFRKMNSNCRKFDFEDPGDSWRRRSLSLPARFLEV